MTEKSTRRKVSDLENELQERIERYELVSKATNDVLYELNLDGGTVYWNDTLHSQFGYGDDEEAGTLEWWAEHVHPGDALRLENEVSEWFDSGADTWVSEYRFRKADGSYIEVKDRGYLQRREDGTPMRIIGSLLDVTKQKQLDRAKDEFISLMSHQLRTPLTAIRIYGEMFTDGLMGPLNEQQKRQIAHTIDSSMRLIKMLGDTLDISRVEFSRVFSHREKTGINSFLESHVAELRPIAAEKGAVIRFRPDAEIEEVSVDTDMLGLILHNLLTNAIQYTKSSKGVIELGIRRDKEGYVLSVKDNGVGISKNERDRVFEKYYRTESALSINEHGTGLGLHMVKQLAEIAGYDIWFKSQVNKGTTFFIRLPDTIK